jgi:DNA-binding transcriptional LysR family regulator
VGLQDHARNVLEVVEGMEVALGRQKSSPTGHVRVATPVSFGLMLMAQLPAVMARYPGLTVELVMEDRFGDMIEERLDLAIRVGEVSTQTLIKRSLGTVTRVAVAAPAYLQRRGSPLNPDELIDHDCIVHRVEPGETEWRLTGPNCSVGVSVRGVVSTNNHEAVRGAALSGLGIGLLPQYLVIDDILAGRLVHVLPEYGSETLPIYIVYPSRRHLAPRTRVVIDFLIAETHRLRAAGTVRATSLSTLQNEADVARGGSAVI